MTVKLDISRPVRCASEGCAWRESGADGEPLGEPGKFVRRHSRQRLCPEHEPNRMKARRAAKEMAARRETARAVSEVRALIPARLKARRQEHQRVVDRLLSEARGASMLGSLEAHPPEPDIPVREYVRRLVQLAGDTAMGRPWDRLTQMQKLGIVWVSGTAHSRGL